MLRRWFIAPLAFALLASAAPPARADATAFLGVNTIPANRLTRGLAFGTGLLIIGFEAEYSDTTEDAERLAPSLRTGMLNVLVQTPVPIAGIQFYATAGGGVYRERLQALQETHVGVNIGGGIKLTVAGPLRLRFDYRLFRLNGSPVHSRPQRVYAGLNLAF
jgi:hypothetical protein